MTVRGALKAALGDMYGNSIRFVFLNGAVSAVTIAILVAASYTQPALLLLVLVGPVAAALMHCAVVLVQTQELSVREWFVGLRLHWLRGLILAAGLFVAAYLGYLSIEFYGSRGTLAWPVAVIAIYVLFLFGVWQIFVWPLAIAERTKSFADVLREAGVAFLRRPRAAMLLASALVLINAVGAVGVLPFLTLTVAYSFLAAAHFVLPPNPEEV
jgi:uncharacterized membrane protein